MTHLGEPLHDGHYEVVPDDGAIETLGAPTEVMRAFLHRSETLLDNLGREADELAARTTFAGYCAELDTLATTYPETELWDSFRTDVSLRLYGMGRITFAYNLLNTSDSILQAATVLYKMAEESQLSALQILEEFVSANPELSEDRVARIKQALVCAILIEVPESDDLDALEEDLRRGNPAYDPLEAWLETMQETPYDVEPLRTVIADDEAWGTTPLRARQHIIWQHFTITAYLADELSTELVGKLADDLAALHERYPGTMAIPGIQLTAVDQLLARDEPSFALDVARTVTDDEVLDAIVGLFLHHELPDEALEVVARFRNPSLALYYLNGALRERPDALPLIARFTTLQETPPPKPTVDYF